MQLGLGLGLSPNTRFLAHINQDVRRYLPGTYLFTSSLVVLELMGKYLGSWVKNYPITPLKPAAL